MLRTHFLSTSIPKRTFKTFINVFTNSIKSKAKNMNNANLPTNAMARPAQDTLNSQDTHRSSAHSALHYHSKKAAAGISNSARKPFSKAKNNRIGIGKKL